MAYCPNCGTQNADTASFCLNCGSPLTPRPSASVTPPSVAPPVSSGTASTKSIVAMILGISSLVFSCGPVTGIIAIVLANQELGAIRDGLAPEAGKVLAQIGLWTGWIGTILCGLFWIAYIGVIVFAISMGGAFS